MVLGHMLSPCRYAYNIALVHAQLLQRPNNCHIGESEKVLKQKNVCGDGHVLKILTCPICRFVCIAIEGRSTCHLFSFLGLLLVSYSGGRTLSLCTSTSIWTGRPSPCWRSMYKKAARFHACGAVCQCLAFDIVCIPECPSKRKASYMGWSPPLTTLRYERQPRFASLWTP